MTNRNWPPSRQYSKSEVLADGAVHAVGLALAIIAGAVLLFLGAGRAAAGEYATLVIYVLALVTVMSISFAYNHWPPTPVKAFLRRFDHSAIYLLIAATYTPFAIQLADQRLAAGVLAVVWLGAAAGIAMKLFMPGRYDRVAIGLYLLIGWSGATVFGPLVDVLPPTSLWLIVAGGIAYSSGVIFYALHRMKFQTALWHAFVVLGAGLHMAAVTGMVAWRV